jgi:hypothetical protein
MIGSLFTICQLWAAVISSISRLFSVKLMSGVFCHGAVYFGFCMTPTSNADLLEMSAKISR